MARDCCLYTVEISTDIFSNGSKISIVFQNLSQNRLVNSPQDKFCKRHAITGWGGWIRTNDHGIKTRCLTAWLRPKMTSHVRRERPHNRHAPSRQRIKLKNVREARFHPSLKAPHGTAKAENPLLRGNTYRLTTNKEVYYASPPEIAGPDAAHIIMNGYRF